MPTTLPTIVTPLPNDPRVMLLAKSMGLTRREAFGAAAEAWAWLAAMAVDGIVPRTEPDTLDGVVDVPGFGQAMLAAGLVGTVNDGLVLPGELRQRQRDDDERRSRHRGDDAAGDPDERRRGQQREASRRYRRRSVTTGSKTQPATSPTWRSLGRVAGHDVRVYDGPHGCYARVIGATINGQGCGRFTAGDKGWSLEGVTLMDVLPALVEKWKTLTTARGLDPSPRAEPTYDAFRDAAERLTVLEKCRRDEADRGGDEPGHDDASSSVINRHQRHDDASSNVIISSSSEKPQTEPKSIGDMGLPRHHASSFADDDGPSSSSLSKSSSSNEEEDMRGGRKAGDIHDADERHGDDAEPDAYREWKAKRQQTEERYARIAAALGDDIGAVRLRYAPTLALQCRQAGIDFRTGLPIDAGGSHEPAGAPPAVQTITEGAGGNLPATGSVEPRGGGDDEHDPQATRATLAALGAVVTPKRPDDLGDDADGQHATLKHVRRGA